MSRRRSGYNTVTAFFDESGKFKDHKVISFGGVAGFNEEFVPFADDWGNLLYRNGLQVLSAKDAFNARRPLSQKNVRVGIRERVEDLLPFITCIRKHLSVVTGITIDVQAFKKLPSHFFQSYGNDPVFMAFARALLKVVEFTPNRDKISFICDDEEQVAFPIYRLYRRVKTVYPAARNKLVGITFADDRVLFGLQAADLVAALLRLEAGKKWLHVSYDTRPLFHALSKSPEKQERIWEMSIAFGDKRTLIGLAESLKAEREKRKADTKIGR
ncbi:MAG TPA: DUF3800 domain-containing protein [Candidatus Acidoferrum sp.]|nr:DUF3800 domain-containing protein [Candidatus Acidoferrum sp.]